MGRFFDGARTNLSGQGFLLGFFDSDPAADVMRGGDTQLKLFTASPEGFLVPDGAVPISEPFSPSAVANMNGDGIPDLVGSTPSGFGILMGTPGGFEVTPARPSGAPASWDAIGDVDGDGLADLVAREGDVVAIYFNRGEAFLKVASVIGSTSGGMAVADMDGDGDGEVITFGYSPPFSSALLVLRPTAPTGTLEKWKEIAVDGPGELLPADFDGDGAIDIAASCSWAQVFLFWNSGTGDLDPIAVGSSTDETADMAAEDINGDQRRDLLCLYSIPSDGFVQVRVWINQGNRQFDTGSSSISGGSYAEGNAMGVGDVDHDGTPDVVVAQAGGLFATLFRGRAQSELGQRSYPVGISWPGQAWAADFEGRARDGVLVASSDAAMYFESRPDGTLESPISVPEAAGAMPLDLGGDGRDDLIRSSLGEVVIRTCLGGLNFAAPETLRYGSFKGAADLDGDGVLDLLVGNKQEVRSVPGIGGGSFGPPGPVLNVVHDELMDATLSDLDGDGAADLAAIEQTADEWHLVTYHNNGSAGFTPWREFALPVSYGIHDPYIRPGSIHLMKLDADSNPDLAIQFRDAERETVYVFRGLGDGLFSRSDTVQTWLGEAHINTFADLDGDGMDELIVTSYSPGSTAYLLIWANLGGAFETEPFVIHLQGYPSTVVVGDFDGNGAPDLVHALHRAGSGRTDHVMLHMNRGEDHSTPALASLVTAVVAWDRVQLIWHVGDADAPVEIERRAGTGLWERIGSQWPSMGQVAFEDREVHPGGEYLYRLTLHTAEGDYTTQPFTARIPIPALSLRAIHGKDARRMGFALRTMGLEPVEIAIHDLQGRRVASQRFTPRTPGETVEVEMETSVPMKSGMYWATAAQGASKVTVRVVRLL